MRVLGGGFTKIGDTSTYSAYDTDGNGALVNYRIVPEGQPYASNQFIEGTTNQQAPASVEAPVPDDQVDVDGAFALYRGLTQEMAACPATVTLTDAGGDPTPRPVQPGTAARFTLEPGRTNVLSLTAAELDDLSELTFVDQPTAGTPLLVNVTGTGFDGNVPNLAGVGGAQAPYILWNFPDAVSITVTGGDSLEGTIYAPDADVVWAPTQNIEGNVIAREFTHGPAASPPGTPREIHDFAFGTTISCGEPEPEPEARLTLVKEVVNDDGGTAGPGDWTLSATPANDPDGAISGVTGHPSVTGAAVTPGDWTLAESGGPEEYVAGEWTCDGGDVADGVVTLADGDDVTCVVVNDDDGPGPEPGAWLTLVKEVVNDDGGTAEPTDWTLSATRGEDRLSGVTGEIEDVGVAPGRWTLAEHGGPGGYVAGAWRCDRGSLAGDVVTIPRGARVTCTVVNDDRGPRPDPTTTSDPAILPASASRTPDDGILPDTGGPAAAWAVAGLAALLAGAALVASGRREETD
jgi:choice-of-anchor A domain-containing protein/LPXTG-motif cell wall-anchored protein